MNNLPEKEIKFVATYKRVSTAKQEEEQTIELQTTAIKDKVKEHGYEIIKEYIDEDWGGDSLERPGLDQLRLDAKSKLWDAVIIYDPGRLARRSAWQEVVIEELKELGVDTLFVTIPKPTNDYEIISNKMRGVFDEFERMKIKERFRMGKITRVRQGHILTTEGAYGLTYVPNTGKRGTADYIPGHVVVNEYEKGNLEQIFKMVADDRMTLRGVVRELHRLGIPPRKSKRGVWSTSTLSTMLKNKIYIGQAHWGASFAIVPENPIKHEKYKKNKKTSRRTRPEDQWEIINIPPILDKDLFDRANAQLRKNFETLGRNKKNNFLLAGSIFCNCGGRRAGEGVQHGKHLYYRCSNRVRTFPLPPTCKEAGINAKIVDEVVWNNIQAIMSSPELIREQIEKWQKKRGGEIRQESTINTDNIRKEIVKLRGQEDRYAHLYAQEAITEGQYLKYVDPVRQKIGVFENQIEKARLEETPKDELVLPGQSEIEIFVQEASQYLENLNFEARQDLVRRASTKVISAKEELHVHGFISLNQFNVVFRPQYRNRRAAERGEVHALQCAHQ